MSADGRGWRAYLVGADENGFGQPETVLIYCPTCCEREFGDQKHALGEVGSKNPARHGNHTRCADSRLSDS